MREKDYIKIRLIYWRS